MFESVIRNARRSANALLAKYFARAVVAVPFVVAASFATAAGTLALVEEFGAQKAYLIVALAFTVLGTLAAIVVSVKESEPEPAEAPVVSAAVGGPLDTAEDAFAPVAMLLPLLTSPLGLSTALGLARRTLRNVPLLVLIASVALLSWPADSRSDAAPAGDGSAPEPDGTEAMPRDRAWPSDSGRPASE